MNGKRAVSEQALQRKQYFEENENGIPNGKINDIENLINRRNNDVKDKLYIVDTLLGINGSMKQFSNDLENKLHNAFESSAGKIYGKKYDPSSKYPRIIKFDSEGLQNVED